jgi:prepilin-type N-terminal cleavage/methylation domain-containing protein
MYRFGSDWNRGMGSRPGRNIHRTSAFTLVELLVVIAIIGLLVALTMPAVMSAIESARRSKCANNMKQIAVAAVNYESTLRQYPLNWEQVTMVGTAMQGAGPTGTTGVSWMAGILPQLDDTPLYNQIFFGSPGPVYPTLGYQTSPYNNLAVLETVIPTFLCPSDTQTGYINTQLLGGTSLQYATTNYKACAGMNWAGGGPTGLPAVSWSHGRNSGNTNGLDFGNGVICRGGATTAGGAPFLTSNVDIRDGASNTIFLGESVPAWSGWSLWFWPDGSTATCGIPLNYRYENKPPDTYYNQFQAAYGFMSRHVQGANFASCDGSVHFISNLIDSQIYQGLATIDGNESTTADGSQVEWPQ